MCNYKIISFLLLICFPSTGQVVHTNPFKANFSILNFEHSQKEIVDYKIRKITSGEVEIKKDGTKKKIPKTSYYMLTFNKDGKPVHCYYKDFISTSRSETHDFSLDYDSLHNLIHIHEYQSEFFSSQTHDENDVYYFYDKKNRLIRQEIIKRYIYEPKSKQRKGSYSNDTTITNYKLNYDTLNRVTTIHGHHYSSLDDALSFDTTTYNCSFDSIFIETDIPKGVKVDSLGRVVQDTNYMVSAKLMGGGCIHPDSPNDIISTYFYNAKGQLIKAEKNTREGKFMGRRFWVYNENGLLQSYHVENSDRMIIYEYEFY